MANYSTSSSSVAVSASSSEEVMEPKMETKRLSIDTSRITDSSGKPYQVPSSLGQYVGTYSGAVASNYYAAQSQLRINEDGTYQALGVQYSVADSNWVDEYHYFDEADSLQKTTLKEVVVDKKLKNVTQMELSIGVVLEAFDTLYLIPLNKIEASDIFIDMEGNVDYRQSFVSQALDVFRRSQGFNYPKVLLETEAELMQFYQSALFQYSDTLQLNSSELDMYSGIKNGELRVKVSSILSNQEILATKTNAVDMVVTEDLEGIFSKEQLQKLFANLNGFYQSQMVGVEVQVVDPSKIYSKDGQALKDVTFALAYKDSGIARASILYKGRVYQTKEVDDKYIIDISGN